MVLLKPLNTTEVLSVESEGPNLLSILPPHVPG